MELKACEPHQESAGGICNSTFLRGFQKAAFKFPGQTRHVPLLNLPLILSASDVFFPPSALTSTACAGTPRSGSIRPHPTSLMQPNPINNVKLGTLDERPGAVTARGNSTFSGTQHYSTKCFTHQLVHRRLREGRAADPDARAE